MRSARELTLGAIGAVVAAAGFEHGLGELLQGPVAPADVVIQSWPDSAFYRSLGGEPAMTLIPNLAVSGVLTMALSAGLFVWMIWFVGRRRSALVIAALSIALLLVGGGFGPPLLGLILAMAAIKVNSPLRWWRERCPAGLRRLGSAAWPVLLAACLTAWVGMLVGVPAAAYFAGIDNEWFILSVLLSAFVLLPIALLSSMARDAESAVARSVGSPQ